MRKLTNKAGGEIGRTALIAVIAIILGLLLGGEAGNRMHQLKKPLPRVEIAAIQVLGF